MGESWFILGCGYTGARLARRLRGEGASPITTRRRAEAAAAITRQHGVAGVAVDLAQPETLAGVIPEAAIVVHTAPPGSDSPAADVGLVDAAARAGALRFIYLSSTGVYPAGHGAWIDETVAPAPIGPAGHARLAAERAVLAAAARHGLSAVALRIAGIYGPGRGVHARLAAGDYRVIGEGAGFVSRIHVDDLVSAIVAVGRAAALAHSIYNVADDEPTTARAHADAVAAFMELPPPPSIAEAEATPEAIAMATANRRIANQRLTRELGIAFEFSSWRGGVPASLAEEKAHRLWASRPLSER